MRANRQFPAELVPDLFSDSDLYSLLVSAVSHLDSHNNALIPFQTLCKLSLVPEPRAALSSLSLAPSSMDVL